MLAITFTNKAADEMRHRLRELLGEVADRMWVSTFHSACVRILRSQADRLGYRKSFTIYDDADSRRLIEQVERDLGLDTRRLSPRSVQGAISAAKSELLDFETYKPNAADLLRAPRRRHLRRVPAASPRCVVRWTSTTFSWSP